MFIAALTLLAIALYPERTLNALSAFGWVGLGLASLAAMIAISFS